MGYTRIAQRHGRQSPLRILGIDLVHHASWRGPPKCPAASLQLRISADGKKLYMYGAGFEIEVYDAVTFQREATGIWERYDRRDGRSPLT